MTVAAALGILAIPILFIWWMVSEIDNKVDVPELPKEWDMDTWQYFMETSLRFKDDVARKKWEKKFIENWYKRQEEKKMEDKRG